MKEEAKDFKEKAREWGNKAQGSLEKYEKKMQELDLLRYDPDQYLQVDRPVMKAEELERKVMEREQQIGWLEEQAGVLEEEATRMKKAANEQSEMMYDCLGKILQGDLRGDRLVTIRGQAGSASKIAETVVGSELVKDILPGVLEWELTFQRGNGIPGTVRFGRRLDCRCVLCVPNHSNSTSTPCVLDGGSISLSREPPRKQFILYT